MVINRKVLPWLIAGIALAAILLIVLVMVTQAAPDSAPHRQGGTSPGLVSYQGQVNISGVPYSGTGYFRFAIVDIGGTFYWSNDGTDAITPTEAVTLTVVNGLFNVLLGETNPITYGVFSDSDRWLRVWFDDGTHSVQLLEPDTRLTTAPFAFQADNATTATVAMNAITFNTSKPSIVGDPYNGNERNSWAVDLQLSRDSADYIARGPYSTIGGGHSNFAGGSFSTIPGGGHNKAFGYISTVLGGWLNEAEGEYSVASGRRAKTGLVNGVFIFGDSTDEDFEGITQDEFAIRARGGFRHAYDNSNWWTAKVDSGGAVSFDSVGTTPGFTINDSLTVNGAFSATVLTATYATTALTATNATTATYATTALTATNATTATYATTALTATNATTATYATTALTATNATTATYATTATAFNGSILTVPGTSGSATKGLVVTDPITKLANFQGLDSGGATYSFFGTNRTWGTGSTWTTTNWYADRKAASLQIKDDMLNLYQFGVSSITNTEVLRVASGGDVSILKGKLLVSTSQTPATSGAACTVGQIAWDASYIYVCIATNTWKRAAIGTW